MDARGWVGPPDAQDDAYEHDGHLRRTREQRFSDACNGLLQWIHAASDRRLPLYAAYRGNSQANAIWYARLCYREARALGLLQQDEMQEHDDYARGRTQANSRRQDLARQIHR